MHAMHSPNACFIDILLQFFNIHCCIIFKLESIQFMNVQTQLGCKNTFPRLLNIVIIH